MKARNFSGMGDHYAAQDAFASETPGPIHDRSRERVGTTDVCIVAARRQLLAGVAAVQAGRDPIHVIRDPAQTDMSHIVVASEVVPRDVDHGICGSVEQHRRRRPPNERLGSRKNHISGLFAMNTVSTTMLRRSLSLGSLAKALSICTA